MHHDQVHALSPSTGLPASFRLVHFPDTIRHPSPAVLDPLYDLLLGEFHVVGMDDLCRVVRLL